MTRTNIEFKGFELPNPIGTAIGYLVGRAIANMSFDTYYKIEHVTPDEGSTERPYTELAYDNDACEQAEGITWPNSVNQPGLVTVRIYEGSIAGWADIEFYDKTGKLVFFRKNVLPFYTGALTALVSEYLLGGTVFHEMAPTPVPGQDGWFLEGYVVPEPATENVYPTASDAMAAEPNVPLYIYRLRDAAIELGLTETVNDLENTIAEIGDSNIMDLRGFRPIFNEASERTGVRFYKNDEVMAEAYQMQANLTGEVLTPIHPYIQNLMNEAMNGWRPVPTQL